MIGSSSAPDPFIFPEISGVTGNYDTNSKTLVSSALNGGIRNCVLLIAGQSNVCNSAPTIYTPTNAGKVDNFCIYNGATYSAVDPLLGCSTAIPAGNFAGRLADKLINANKFDRVILCPVGVDGTAISLWTNNSNLGSRITVGLARLAARGLTPTAILWGQGESDHGTSQVNYQAALGGIIANSRVSGYAGPWFIAKETWLGGAVDADVQNAQLAIVDHSAGIWAGPNADSLNASNRQGDNTHFNDTGADAYAALCQTALGLFGAPF